jgi:two-component system response regulator HydG
VTGTILIVDDDEGMCRMLETGLAARGYEATSRTSADAALELLHTRDFDTVITDVRMRGLNGIELCARIVDSRPDIPVIVITAFGSMEAAIEAIRAGAYDFVTKPFELDAIRMTVQRAVMHRALSRQVARLEQALRETRTFESLLGSSTPMRRIYDLIERVAPSDTAVLITGESGTGKELVARALHRRSPRQVGPFVAINCAAMPENLLEGELFGHVKGAFTDAKTDRPGLFQQAHRGTLFLDEIGELPLGLQPKLLRALQEKCVRPIGSQTESPFDARIIAATNRDLETAVAEGRFRDDLYYRIHVIQIDMPPLRTRGNDILVLAQHFVERFASISGKPVRGILPAAAEKLLAYSWPGNVRELQNCIERAVTLCRYSELTLDDLPEKVQNSRRAPAVIPSDEPSDLVSMEEIERRYVMRVFEATGRNKSLAAKILGFNRKTLYRKLRRYGVIAADDPEE